jgi:adenylate cyclase
MGTSESALLHGFAERAVAAGVPLARATALIDTLHPIHEGRVFRWRADGTQDRFGAPLAAAAGGQASGSPARGRG